MEATAATSLRKFLQGFCHDLHWDYAVFWKLQQDQMLLKWEEGYCHQPTRSGAMESEPVDMGSTIADPIFSSTSGSSQQNECSYDFTVGISLNDIASAQYRLGEGVVGRVALTGNHSWNLSEDLLACDFQSNAVPECPDEWLLQFAMGIKTIVLIPVPQHGVLQIGSSKKVGEDPMLVSLVNFKFNAYLNSMDMSPTHSVEVKTQTSSSSISKLNLDRLSKNTIWNRCYISEEHMVNSDNILRGNDISCQFAGLDGILPFDIDIVPETVDINMIRSSTVEESMKPLSYSDYNFGIFAEDIKIEPTSVEPFTAEDIDCMTNVNSLFSFQMDCELHKALGPSFQSPSDGHLWDPSIASDDTCSSSSELLKSYLIQGNEPSMKPSKFLPNRDDMEHLLEEVYATMDSYLNDDMFRESNDAKSSVESLVPLSASATECASKKEMGVPSSSVTITSPTAVVTHSPPPYFIDNIFDEHKIKKGCKDPLTKKGSKVCKKRAGTGGSPRPRPRDRQLIQDRVKELRELVPNGSKCSIDGLLDRTIKHMLFLKGISERAGKLRSWVNEEVTGQKKMRLSSPEPNKKSGTSWAFELGSDFQVCPIVVKDLEHPGHMLIEMLCNDNGLFLEIAEVIRRLDLTILKGVLESHADNTWAHFIVEVSEGFQRLDIFWPLMQLLQKDRTPVLDRI